MNAFNRFYDKFLKWPIYILGLAMLLLFTCNKIKHSSHDCSNEKRLVINEKKEEKSNYVAYAIQYWKVLAIDCLK